MRRKPWLILFVFAAFLLTASAPPIAAQSSQVVLDVVLDHTQLIVYQEIFTRFQALHPEVKLDLQVVPSGAEGLDQAAIAKVVAQFAAGDPVDLVLMHMPPGAEAQGQVVDLAPFIERDADFRQQFPPEIIANLDSEQHPGKIFSFPSIISGSEGIVYRKSYLAEAGFGDPREGWTKDELFQIATKTVIHNDQASLGFQRMGYNATKNGWENWITYSMQERVYDPVTKEWWPEEQSAIEAFDFVAKLIGEYRVGEARGWAWFARGDAAMMNGNPELFGRELSFDSQDMGFVHFPVWRDGMTGIMPWGASGGIAIGNSGDPEKIRWAWEFIKFRNSPEIQLLATSIDPSLIPTNSVAMQSLDTVLPFNMPGRDALLYSLQYLAHSPPAPPARPLYWDPRVNPKYEELMRLAFELQIPAEEYIRQIKDIVRAVYREDGLL